MKKILPAVFAQKKLTRSTALGKIPASLRLFEADLARVAGGMQIDPILRTDSACADPERQMTVFDDCQD